MSGPDEGAGSAIPFALPDITDEEIEAVTDVLRSKWLTTGAQARAFEEQFAQAVNSQHAVALSSCTAALHLGLEALGVGPGDLVFVPTFTFAASAEVVRYLGATPVLVDVDDETLNIDLGDLRQRVSTALAEGSGRPAAVVPVHFSGVPADLEALWDLAREFDLAVVEDAAHAFPTFRGDVPIGWQPPDVRGVVCFSFYATKTITTGEGGMLCTNDAQVANRVRQMSLHGLSKQAWKRYAGGTWKYDIVAPGYKYNLTDIAAAMGLVQLRRASEMASRRAAIAERYCQAFKDLPQVRTPTVPAGTSSPWHLYVLRVRGSDPEPRRDRMIELLNAHGVGTSVHFIPLHLHSYYIDTYGYRPHDFPHAYGNYQRAVSLPIYSAMTDADVERVVWAVTDVVARTG